MDGKLGGWTSDGAAVCSKRDEHLAHPHYSVFPLANLCDIELAIDGHNEPLG